MPVYLLLLCSLFLLVLVVGCRLLAVGHCLLVVGVVGVVVVVAVVVAAKKTKQTAHTKHKHYNMYAQ